MAAWLYQMTSNTEEPWNPSAYRYEVWEGKSVTWSVGKVTPRKQGDIAAGDIIIFFFSKSRTEEPGLYGWGIVTDFIQGRNQSRITFQAAPPSDYLKMTPCWNKEVEKLVDQIRKPIKQGTVWGITPQELKSIRQCVLEHFD